MKALYVRKLFLWPRYQGAVKDSLEKHECEVRHPEVHTVLRPILYHSVSTAPAYLQMLHAVDWHTSNASCS